MNVLMFFPLGLLIGCVFKNISWKKVLIASLCLSVLIEFLQFLLKRGFAELDDVMHNTLGAVIGFGLYVSVATLVKFMTDRKKQYDH